MKIKKNIFILMGLSLFVISFGYAGNILYTPINDISLLECTKTKDVDLYIENLTEVRSPYESFANDYDSVIKPGPAGTMDGNSEVKIWANGNITDCDNWNRVSNIVPAGERQGNSYRDNDYKVVFREDSCTFHIPSQTKENNPNRVDAVIYYDINYGIANRTFWGGYMTYWYYRMQNQTNFNCYPNGRSVDASDLSSCPRRRLKFDDRHYEGDCLNYRIFRCGDGIVNNPNGTNEFSNGNFTEECDDGELNGTPGHCNSDCTVNPNPIDPVCLLLENPVVVDLTDDTNYEVATCNGNGDVDDFLLRIYSPDGHYYESAVKPSLNNQAVFYKDDFDEDLHTFFEYYGCDDDGVVCEARCFVKGGDGTWIEPTPDSCVQEVNSENTNEFCGDGILQDGENCESTGTIDNIIIPGPGCGDDCVLDDVECDLSVYDGTNNSSHTGDLPFTEGFSAWTLMWADFVNLDFGDGNSVIPTIGGAQLPRIFMNNEYHTYQQLGHYNPTLYVRNNYNLGPILPGTDIPEAECSTYVDVIGDSELWIEKINMDPSIVYPAGGDIVFRINFGNNGNLPINVDVYDTLPDELFYLTSSIYSGSSNNVLQGNYILNTGDHYFAYSGLTLEPGASGYVLLDANISSVCSGIFLNTGFVGIGDEFQYSVDNFECNDSAWIKKLQSVNGSEFTGATLFVEPYDYISYKIEFSSESILTDTYFYDILPEGVRFVTGYITIADGNPLYSGLYINGFQDFVQSQNFDLNPNTTGYVIITGQIVSGFDIIGNTYENIATFEGVSDNVIAILTGNLPQLSINKELTNTGYFLGEEVGFRLSFANTGYSPATGIVISDYMPASLSYNGNYFITGISNYDNPLITYNIDGTTEIIFNNITIDPFSSGYILLTGVVQNYDGQDYLCDSAINMVFMSGSILSGSIYDWVQFYCEPLVIEKNVVDSSGNNLNINGNVPNYLSGDSIFFDIELSGMSQDVVSIYLTDIWPDLDQNCVQYLGWSGIDWSQSGTDLVRNYIGNDVSASLLLSGLILSDDESCVGNYFNTGVIFYDFGDNYSGSDDAEFVISRYNMVIQKTSSNTGLQQSGLITFDLFIENRGTEAISGLIVSDIWPGTLDIEPNPSDTIHWYDYEGTGSIVATSISDITGGSLIQWFFEPNFEFQPGATGHIILTGRLVR